jgi:hypothetical protein
MDAAMALHKLEYDEWLDHLARLLQGSLIYVCCPVCEGLKAVRVSFLCGCGVRAGHAATAFLRNEPPPEQNDAHWLLDFYTSFMSCHAQDTTDRVLDCLAQVIESQLQP